jgi:hypothetical protein
VLSPIQQACRPPLSACQVLDRCDPTLGCLYKPRPDGTYYFRENTICSINPRIPTCSVCQCRGGSVVGCVSLCTPTCP